jgi:predicted GIY-YIG superfamily endonuclease
MSEAPSTRTWFVYVLVSPRLDRTYVGISIEPQRRLDEHNGLLPGGAKSTRAGRPWNLGVIYGPFPDRGEATRIEIALKKLRGARRLEADWPHAPWELSDGSADETLP